MSDDAARPTIVLPLDDVSPPRVTQRTLAAWRAELANLRVQERQQSIPLTPEIGRLLEVVGQALAQGGGALPSADITSIVELTHVDATYS